MQVGEREAVGREAELARIASFLDGAQTERALWLEGDAGIGKSVLLQAAGELARERGDLVLSCRAAAAETNSSFASLADLIEPVADEVLPALPGPQREAAELLADLEEWGRRMDSPWARATGARCRGLLRSASGDVDGALGSFQEALHEHELLPMPFDRGRTLLALGVAQRRVKQKRAARESLMAALAIFEELGAKLWASRARSELKRIGGRVGGRTELTETERRVAELAAAGRKNSEVAAELYISVRSVEWNLSKVYAKLGVRSRTELARNLRV